MIFDPLDVIHVTWRRVLRTPLPLLEGVLQVQTGVSIEMLCAELVTKEIQHLRPDYEKHNNFFSLCIHSLLYGATQR